MAAYYNEFKLEAAHMLRQLIRDGLIADGVVDERSITEVSSNDIKGFTQCHFFAGIGGWSVALRLAGWDDARPVWTGSCPCQPFSSAGKQKGHGDERHLWPHWARLIRECRPPAIFGEQVASAITYGWWDDVATDMEAEGYACAAAVLPACSVGRPHKRDRLWFVADSGFGRFSESSEGKIQQPRGAEAISAGILEHATGERCGEAGEYSSGLAERASGHGTMGDSQHNGRNGRSQRGSDAGDVRQQESTQGAHGTIESSGAGEPEHVAYSECRGRQGQRTLGESEHSAQGCNGQADQSLYDSAGLQWIACPDGKARPVESGLCLLAHGVQHRAPVLHAFGNAIVPEVAAEFIKATM